MPFQKGRKKTGGRAKGTKNKLNLGIQEKLWENGVDCIDEVLNIAQTTEDETIKVKIYLDLIKYIYPQRKAVEMSGEVGGYVININNKAVKVERD